MRVSSGKYKGRLINGPKHIRPTQGKVREALFDILGDIRGLSFLELFAGSGAVGFEALSRGAGQLSLVEYDRSCLQAIRKNIESMKIEACHIYPYEAHQALGILQREGKSFDIVFLDPPYHQQESNPVRDKASKTPDGCLRQPVSNGAKKALKALGGYDIVTRYGLVVLQHFKKEALPETAGSLILFKQARYGDSVLSFYKKVAT